ncbi:hypothetical protein AcW1_002847 [Taiwanofungus camphoratus]|nr:hypothetical protein AcW1_002847 [Antrodia cinnamomea]
MQPVQDHTSAGSQQLDPHVIRSKTKSGVSLQTSQDAQLTRKTRAEAELETSRATATVLNSHEQMSSLLSEFLMGAWPFDDKIRDQLPPNYKPRQVAGSNGTVM